MPDVNIGWAFKQQRIGSCETSYVLLLKSTSLDICSQMRGPLSLVSSPMEQYMVTYLAHFSWQYFTSIEETLVNHTNKRLRVDVEHVNHT